MTQNEFVSVAMEKAQSFLEKYSWYYGVAVNNTLQFYANNDMDGLVVHIISLTLLRQGYASIEEADMTPWEYGVSRLRRARLQRYEYAIYKSEEHSERGNTLIAINKRPTNRFVNTGFGDGDRVYVYMYKTNPNVLEPEIAILTIHPHFLYVGLELYENGSSKPTYEPFIQNDFPEELIALMNEEDEDAIAHFMIETYCY